MGRYRIVLADDHVLIRQGVRSLIDGTEDLEVVGEAGDAAELLKLLDSVVPDLIILDISMPRMKGIEALGEIKVKCPGASVLILSMHKEYLHTALSRGANGYLLKEDADRDLFSAISSIRQGRIYVSSHLTNQLVSELGFSAGPLSAREKEVLRMIAGGSSNREIAGALSISIRTVETHRANIMDKLKLKNVADLIKYAIGKGYI